MDDGRLLKSATVNLMFTAQLNTQVTSSLMQLYQVEDIQERMVYPLHKGASKTFGLGGMLVSEHVDGDNSRRKGTMVRGGLPNIIWMIDREAALCAFYASQVRPPGYRTSTKVAETFERTIYARRSSVK